MRFHHSRPLLVIIVSCYFNVSLHSQTSANYSVSTNTSATLLADKNGNSINFSNSPNLIANNIVSTNSTVLPIGFDLIFMGKLYTHFVVGGYGQIGLAVAGSPSYILGGVNDLTRAISYPPDSFNDAPLLAAFSGDQRTARTGPTIQSTISGSYPHRCLVVQWNSVVSSTSTTAVNPADAVFQARIYESTGEIEYVYGKMTIGNGSTTVTASIGFSSGNTDNSFLAISSLSSFSATRVAAEEFATQSLVSSATPGIIAGLHSTTEGVRRKISMTPVTCNGSVTASSVTRVLAKSMKLNWTDNITNNFGWMIYRSVSDSNNYQLLTTLPPNANTYDAKDLQTNTRYYWKVIPFTEGNTDIKLVLTDSTRCSMAGIYKIGPGGNFSSIRAAQDSLALWGMVGNITWELVPSFSFASESLPVSFKSLAPCHEKDYTLTLQPAAGANFNIINNSATPVFLIDSSKNIILEGRAAGTGPVALTLEGAGELIRIVNGWQNRIRYIEFKSSTNFSTVSPVTVEGKSGGGSYSNNIENCELHDRGASFSLPVQLIRSVISNGAPNYNNTVSRCRLYNFRRYALDIDGKGWIINDNSFYATLPVAATDSSGFINISTNDNSMKNQITGNYFGGSSPNCGGNVLIWNASWFFNGIGTNASATIKNNRFKRLKIVAATTQPISSYIDLIRVGKFGSSGATIDFTIEENQFGDLNPADSISYTYNPAYPYTVETTIVRTVGVAVGSIQTNTMVHIRTSVVGTNTDILSLRLLETNSGNTVLINKNILGTVQQDYKIIHKGSGMMTAIYSWGRATITDNLITNIVAKNAVIGISKVFDEHFDPTINGKITGNTISYIKSLESVSGAYFSVAGIYAARSGVLIERNKILHMEDSSMISGGPVSIFSRDCNNTINANFIDGTGKALSMDDDRSVITNNMIRLGIDSAGNATSKWPSTGYSNTYTTNNRVVHNTIYIAGHGEGSSECVSYYGSSSFVNNILVNVRTSTSGINSIFSTASSSHDSYSDYNVCYQGTNTIFSTAYPRNLNFQQWKDKGKDVHSVLVQPNFVLPDGPTRLLDLHVTGTTPAERRGTSFGSYSTTFDFDGDVRANNSPVDIGADAGNYLPLDLDPPNITVVPLPDATDTTSRYISISITDALKGLNVTGNERPTIWYRKSYPSTSPWQFSYGTLVSGTAKDGNWRFYIDHQLVNVTHNGSDSIQYYFVAQDTTFNSGFNLSVSPAQGAVHTTVSQQVSAPLKPYTYRIRSGGYIIPSVVNVGVNQRYTSLTADGGVFEGLKRDSIKAGNLTIRIISHLNENGKWALDSTINKRGVNVTIVPSHDSLFVIRNNADLNTEMIRVDSYDNLTIDGSFNGSGRWLRFINAHSDPANAKSTLALISGTDSVQIRNSQFQNNMGKYDHERGILTLAKGTKKDLVISNNIFSNIEGNSGKPTIGISADRTSTPIRLSIHANHFVNMENAGIRLNPIGETIRIDSNHFYWNDLNAHHSTFYHGIYTFAMSMSEINDNYFGGSQPFCKGKPWIHDGAFQNFMLIDAQGNSNNDCYIQRNTIQNIQTTHVNAANFFPIQAYGRFSVLDNTIGDSTNRQSMELAASNIYLIYGSGRRSTISGNLVAGITCTNATVFYASTKGIFAFADSAVIIRNNIVRDITVATSIIGNDALTGIYVGTPVKNNLVEQNEVFNLSATHSGAVKVTGFQTSSAHNGGGIMRKNRVYNITMPNSINGTITGFHLSQNGSWKVENNQIRLTNGLYPNPVKLYGIYDKSTINTENDKSIDYNTIVLGGSQVSGTTSSFGFHNEGIGVTKRFKNNLIINERTGGSAQHGAVAVKVVSPSSVWSQQTSDYNLFVTTDTSSAFLWGNNILSMAGWRSITGSDRNGYITPKSVLSVSTLFVDPPKGNLDINTANNFCWYVNGKGIPLNDIDADFKQTGIRSVSVDNGSVDIGSHEFNTNTTPPAVYVYGRHAPGGTDTLSFNGRIIATIQWDSQGTLPDLGNARLYTGTWPNDLTNGNTIANARTWSSYLDLPATGGSGYSYDLTLYYDSSMLGKISDEATMIVNKRESDVTGSWQEIHPNVVDRNNRTITITNQRSFSEFTVTDSLATLVTGIPSAELTISEQTVSANSVSTGSVFTTSFIENNSGAANASAHKIYFYLSADTILTPGTNGDSLLNYYDVVTGPGAGANSGTINQSLTMPCVSPESYFLFVVADGANQVNEPNENNNALRIGINVTTGLTLPSVPTIVATPSATICPPGNAILTASLVNCSSCIYTWNTGASGNSITVNTAGNYIVTATNACGSTTATQPVVVSPQSPVPTITQVGNSLTSSSSAGNTWYLNDTAIAGATGAVYEPSSSGLYTVTTNTNGCTSPASDPFNFVYTAINSPDLDTKMQIGPNPVKDELFISYQGNPTLFMLTIVDLTGKEVLGKKQFARNTSLNMGRLAAGLYILRIYNQQNKEYMQRMILKK
ncbi:T9SS type A sorting domain-containing protein [Terrimonas pollutisoli]|uniref:T9SS type A sorting domain-containing protein n=1 Tax=Terrimonas pollutisoli TaxID=3034147 RepID=UPI0023EBF2A4|nr:T9SS type A sorting domain-containing protein [Terrimonas sp. H1YJ31]